MIYPPLHIDYQVPSIKVFNEQGESFLLPDLIHQGKHQAVLLIPGFTQCQGVCPMMAKLYTKILDEAQTKQNLGDKVRVMFFSFDPTETGETLKDFRENFKLSKIWELYRSDPESTQKLLSSLNYTVMSSGKSFQHPAQGFMFTKSGDWVGSLYGADVTGDEFNTLFRQVEWSENYPIIYKLAQNIKNPNLVIGIAGTGFLISVVVLFILGIRLGRRKGPVV